MITRYRIGQANFHGRSFPLSIPGEQKKLVERKGGREGGKNDQGAITNFFLPPLCFPPSGPVAFDLKVLITGIVSSRILQMGIGAGLNCHKDNVCREIIDLRLVGEFVSLSFKHAKLVKPSLACFFATSQRRLCCTSLHPYIPSQLPH